MRLLAKAAAIGRRGKTFSLEPTCVRRQLNSSRQIHSVSIIPTVRIETILQMAPRERIARAAPYRSDDDSYWGTQNRTYEGFNARQLRYIGKAGWQVQDSSVLTSAAIATRLDTETGREAVLCDRLPNREFLPSLLMPPRSATVSFALAVCTPLAS